MATLRDLPHPFPVELAGQQLDKPFYEKGTDEYKRDLEARRGGLKVGRKADQAEIQSIREQIRAGVMPDEQIELYMHRNPGAAGSFKVARENRDRRMRLESILKGSLREAQPAFEAAGPVQPGQPRPVGEAQPARFDAPGAVAQLAAAPGGIEAAQNIAGLFATGQPARGVSTTLQEIRYLESLPEEKRPAAESLMLKLKRGGKVTDLAGGKAIVNPDNTVTDLTTPEQEVAAEVSKVSQVTEAEEETKFRVKSDAEFIQDVPKRRGKRELIEAKVLNVDDAIDSALKRVGAWTTGIPGAVGGLIPGTEAYDLNQDLTTIKANIGFDRLQEMRDASPTGGALGQVAVQELESLQASIRSLDRKQSKESLRKNLQKVRAQYLRWKKANERAKREEAARYNRLTKGRGAQPAPAAPAGEPFPGFNNLSPAEQQEALELMK